MERYDAAGTNFNSSEGTLRFSNVASLTSKWSVSLTTVDIWYGFDGVASSDTLFIIDGTRARAVDLQTGAPRWTINLVNSVPATDSGHAYLGIDYGPSLQAVDTLTGSFNGVGNGLIDQGWEMSFGHTGLVGQGSKIGYFGPIISNGVIYSTTSEGHLVADLTSGGRLWSTLIADPAGPIVRQQLALGGGQLFSVYRTGQSPLWTWHVEARNAITGKVNWDKVVYAGDAFVTAPVFTPTGVVVALRQQAFGSFGYVRRYSLADGTAVEFGAAYGSTLGLIATLDSSPVVANGVAAMYRGPTVGVPLIIQVGAFDLATGNLLWSSPTTQNLTPVMTAANDMLLQCDGTVKIRSLKTGAVAAGALANQPCSGPITVAAGKIIFFDLDQHSVRAWGL